MALSEADTSQPGCEMQPKVALLANVGYILNDTKHYSTHLSHIQNMYVRSGLTRPSAQGYASSDFVQELEFGGGRRTLRVRTRCDLPNFPGKARDIPCRGDNRGQDEVHEVC